MGTISISSKGISAGLRPAAETENVPIFRNAPVVLILLLAGCALTREAPEKPELPLPEALPPVADAMPALPTPWWRVFDDPTLDALIGEALARNPDVEVAAARVAEARAIARAATADRLPAVGIEAGVERSHESVLTLPFPGARTTQTAYYVQGSVRYELDLWGRYAHASEAARARLLASELDQEAVRLSLSGEVARAWYALKAASEQLANARASLANREESLRIERIREEGGESDEFTLKRVQAEVAATRTAEQQFELEVVQRANALAVLLGRSPREMVDGRIVPSGALPDSAPQLPAGLPSSVLEQRPDVRAAEASLEAAAADVGVARADLFPSISLTGLFGWASLELDDLFTAPAETWSAAAALAQPVFEGGRRLAGVDRAQALKQQRRAEYARTVQAAFGEVLDALQGQRSLGSIEESATERTAALSRATELAELRYREGEIAYLELLDVRRDLFQSEIDLVAARRDTLTNAVDLALALGARL
jgi:multidrug efflux system outer membrane protein